MSNNTKAEQAIAHSSPHGGEPHGLEAHLRAVADLAAQHLEHDEVARELARLAGLWHDLGKYRLGFQRYIRQVADAHILSELPGQREKSHSAAGAVWAAQHLPTVRGPVEGLVLARVLQYVIAGHHAGLDDWVDGLNERLGQGGSGEPAQQECREALEGLRARCEAVEAAALLTPSVARLPAGSALPLPFKQAEVIPGRFALWLRMLFSALVDADFLDTEAFMSPDAASERQKPQPNMASLLATFDAYMADKAHVLEKAGLNHTLVNRRRAEVLSACRAKAQAKPGTFTLTVPTGGGKTLAGLAFALTHAVAHGKRRVVMAIPYTSIIEQTAQVYREVFASLGEDVVIEHHSNAEADPAKENTRSRLACENWDAPVIVTTNVQLFESLFARKTSRCRKLHRLAHSVLVIDEAQLLAVEYLQPVVDVLRLLVQDHGVTVVLCTATQPVLTTQRHFGGRGLRGYEPGEVTAIIDDEAALYDALRRVRVHLPADLQTPQSWEVTAQAVLQHEAVLAIVGRRADARTLYELMKRDAPSPSPSVSGDGAGQDLWHLSALMCPQHRSEVIAQIKAALAQRREVLAQGGVARPVRVVSTNLIEAGVDLDLPVVFRALAGLDSIAQAAGRCNREGRLARGDVFVFVPPKGPPPGLMRQAAQACAAVWNGAGEEDDPLALEKVARYFKRLYGDANLDQEGICEALRLTVDRQTWALPVKFRTAAEAFKLIDNEDAATVIVRYHSPQCREDVNVLLALLARDGPSRWLLRKLQRYGVTLYQHDLQRLIKSGDVQELPQVPGLYVQTESDVFYDPVMGAMVGGGPGDPEAFFV